MENTKKNIIARLVAATLLTISLTVSIYFLVIICIENFELDFIVNFMSLIILITATIFEAVILLKNLKKPLMVLSIVQNTNGTNNTTMLIIINIILGLSIIGLIITPILGFKTTNVDHINAARIIIAMFTYIVVNLGLFDFYAILFRFKKFKIEDLAN